MKLLYYIRFEKIKKWLILTLICSVTAWLFMPLLKDIIIGIVSGIIASSMISYKIDADNCREKAYNYIEQLNKCINLVSKYREVDSYKLYYYRYAIDLINGNDSRDNDNTRIVINILNKINVSLDVKTSKHLNLHTSNTNLYEHMKSKLNYLEN